MTDTRNQPYVFLNLLDSLWLQGWIYETFTSIFVPWQTFLFIYILVCNIYPSTREQAVSCTDSVTSGSLVTKSCPTHEIPRTVACQAPLSMRFSSQEHWSGLPFPSPGDLPNPGIEPRSPALQADCFPTELQGKPNIYPSSREQTVSCTDSVTRRLTKDSG